MTTIPLNDDGSPVVFFFGETETGGPAFFWINPYTGKREQIATLWWPEHPVEKTAEVEDLFARLELKVKENL